MLPSRRRKKRTNYGVRTVEVNRGPNGFGFTISGQNPCRISCIVANSPADLSGLRAGDFLISVNNNSVSKITHDAVVNLIGNSIGPIQMTIAENYYNSDSSDEELLDVQRVLNTRKPKYLHKSSRNHHNHHGNNNNNRLHEAVKQVSVDETEEEGGSATINIEYKALIGYVGTIEMPKQLLPNSKLQTVCSCIRKLRQEKRSPTAVLMTVLPTCLTLKNAANSILAIYPTNRVVYIGSTTDKDSRYFAIVTSATGCENNSKSHENQVELSNSCHVFVTDPKISEHNLHFKKAETFKINCTTDVTTGHCLEFPQNALYIVNLVQTMYKLQSEIRRPIEDLAPPVMANSPQPSASSNSDSGIGFRDDFFTLNDRILLVEFPAVGARPPQLPPINNPNRPSGIDLLNIPPDVPFLDFSLPINNLSSNGSKNCNNKHINNLNNIRACEGVKNTNNIGLEKDCETTLWTQTGLPPSNDLLSSSDDNTRQETVESATSTTTSNNKQEQLETEPQQTVCPTEDNVSVCSSKSIEFFNLNGNVFKTPAITKKLKQSYNNNNTRKFGKILSDSCDNLDMMNYKLSPKVYGLSKPNNYSCEELNNLDFVGAEKCAGYGSLQDLTGWDGDVVNPPKRQHVAQSEPDVRFGSHVNLMSEQNGQPKNNNNNYEGPESWSYSFEKLLDDPVGLHCFAEFLKKEFSAENIYFWTACERYRQLEKGTEKCLEARRIHEKHLCSGAPEPVNVDAKARQCTEQSLQNAEDDLFVLAQKQIYNLMKFDSYPRFLKSTLYKECLTGRKEKPQLDAGLLVLPQQNSPKLKKSLSNAEDRRRKSLLPWHRKNRSKSKDRGESEYGNQQTGKKGESLSTNDLSCASGRASDVHSSRSSLTSLDLAISSKEHKMYDEASQLERSALCRVILSNGSTTVVQIRGSETIQQLVRRLLEKRGLIYSAFEVTTDKHPKSIDLNEPSIRLAGCEVHVEQRVVFKLDLPNGKVISVKSKYTKVIVDVLRPILHKYNYSLDQVKISRTSGNKEAVSLSDQVTAIDNARLNIQLIHEGFEASNQVDVANGKSSKNNAKLEEITNQVFDVILQEKADCAAAGKQKSDRGSVKSEDWGSEHSSGIFGKFLRRDSALTEKRKKTLIAKAAENNPLDERQGSVKKPLIAKWKTGVNRQQVMSSESDELVEGLTRAQRSRLEDQRGTEINFELPDFLKDKENERNNYPKPLRSRNGDFVGESMSTSCTNTSVGSKNYENFMTGKTLNNSTLTPSFREHSLNNVRTTISTNNLESGNSQKLSASLGDGVKNGDPPPLPPKPKNVPIKPSNWANSGGNLYNKPKEIIDNRSKPSIFLEQPSSSFV